MRIEVPTTEDVDALADMWVTLARGQRTYGSHLRADENRGLVRDAITRHVVAGRARVARDDDLVGFVTFDVESGVYEQDAVRGVVENLFVRCRNRGEGVGAALLAAAESALVAAGVDVVALEAMATNDDARSFYDEQGYRPHRIEFEKRVESDKHTKDNR
ncbi:MAG: N-acetyltransferase family protein [Halobacteriota archaeon]